MRKFIHLIGNELIKLLRKKALWIMVIILLVAVIGVTALQRVAVWITDFYDGEDGWTLSDQASNDIAYYEQFLNETDWEGNPTENARDAKVMIAYNQYLIDNHIDFEDWRYTSGIIYQMFCAAENGDDALYEWAKAAVDANDFSAYCRMRIEQNKTLYSDDAEMAEAQNWLWNYFLENDPPESMSDWRYQLALSVTEAKATILTMERLRDHNSPSFSEARYEDALNTAAIGEYRLEKNISYNPADAFALSIIVALDCDTLHFWNVASIACSMSNFISLFLIIIAGAIVAEDFSRGTIKFLVLNPVKRWKILMSKYATVILLGIALNVIAIVVGLLSSLVFCGGGEVFMPIITAKGGELVFSSPFLKLIGDVLLAGVETLVMATLAFCLSALFRSSALATGVGIFCLYIGSLVVTLLSAFGFDWARYLLFSNLDFAAIVNGTTVFPHQSLGVAIVIVGLHMVVFLLTAWDAFTRKEI